MGRNRFVEGIDILIDLRSYFVGNYGHLRRFSLQATEEIAALHVPTTVRPRCAPNPQLNWVEHNR